MEETVLFHYLWLGHGFADTATTEDVAALVGTPVEFCGEAGTMHDAVLRAPVNARRYVECVVELPLSAYNRLELRRTDPAWYRRAH